MCRCLPLLPTAVLSSCATAARLSVACNAELSLFKWGEVYRCALVGALEQQQARAITLASPFLPALPHARAGATPGPSHLRATADMLTASQRCASY